VLPCSAVEIQAAELKLLFHVALSTFHYSTFYKLA
jgi:hypothetical protein